MAKELTGDQLRQIVGDVSDAQLTEILALNPTATEVEQAVAWLDNEGDKADRAGHPLAGNVGRIFDILQVEEEEG
jgi:hypothetical protein